MPEQVKMTRVEMQTEALVIERLLDAALAMQCDKDREDMGQMIEKAQERAERLSSALDAVNAPEGTA